MKTSEHVRTGAMLLSRFDQNHPITKNMYVAADEVERLELFVTLIKQFAEDNAAFSSALLDAIAELEN